MPTGLEPPFALKGLGFAHKSEMGAVRLNVTDPNNEPEMLGAVAYLLEEMVAGSIADLIEGHETVDRAMAQVEMPRMRDQEIVEVIE